jgi:hypothetical protein
MNVQSYTEESQKQGYKEKKKKRIERKKKIIRADIKDRNNKES